MGTKDKKILVCGGAGFIGSHFVDRVVAEGFSVVVLDLLTYAGHEINLEAAQSKGDVRLVVGDIADNNLVAKLLQNNNFQYVVNFAAESHVDRSITGPRAFIDTNILGTYNLLKNCLNHFQSLSAEDKKTFRFLQVSTDEVFGELGETGRFSETSPYAPRSPYSASKAAADHLAMSWFNTYELPVLVTNCSNNYGPRQHPEKLIPLMIHNALAGLPLPIYGSGQNIRDWIHVSDHCQGVWLTLTSGLPGQSYCFGGNSEWKNIDLVTELCSILDNKIPSPSGRSYREQISFVSDRPGHDHRYAIDDSKATSQLGFKRQVDDFRHGLEMTVQWYIDNSDWCTKVVAA